VRTSSVSPSRPRAVAFTITPSAPTPAERFGRALRRPLDRFLQLESASSVLLVAATAVALGWANSPWSAAYDAVWHAPLSLGVGSHIVNMSVELVINDVLMAVFFFAIGLEIRRELTTGELREPRRAALPAIAAVGGMVVPAAIYLLLNRGPMARGWGIPMATDIAFAVGVLTLLGRRVPASVRVFLLALAIIDDIGAILVIAIFYSTGVQLDGLGLAVAGLAAVIALQRLGAARAMTYALPAVAVWLGLYRAGVHPTVAGVLLGIMTPARRWPGAGTDTSPAEALERAVHPWVSFAIMPLFALANAGVQVGAGGVLSEPALALGIAGGLLLGKPLGILGASWVAVRLRVASFPAELTWRSVLVVGMVAGIGFTMALFITDLALAPELAALAKLVVLLSSVIAAGATLVVGLFALAPQASAPPQPQRTRRFIPELERGPLAFALLVFGAICAAIELTAPDRIAPHAVLFVVVAFVGLLGRLRRRRADRSSPQKD
jgi:NhaA family Na+:H+ antiporter